MSSSTTKKFNAKDLYTELGLKLKELQELGAAIGIEVKTWNTALEDEQVELLRKAAAGGGSALATLAEELGLTVDALEGLAGNLSVSLEEPENVNEVDRARLTACKEAWDFCTELNLPFSDLQKIGSKIGIEIGRVGFKGLSVPEKLLLRAQYRTHFGGVNRNVIKEASAVEEPKFAAPTGNKAVEAQRETTETGSPQGGGKRERPKAGGGAKDSAPATAPHKAGQGRDRRGPRGGESAADAARTGRKRFEVKESSYASQRSARGGRRDQQDEGVRRVEAPAGPVTVGLPINLRGLSEALGVKVNDIMAQLLREGMMIKVTDSLSEEMIENIGIILSREIHVSMPKSAEELIESELEKFEGSSDDLRPRAPVVTIMGHVDHGKTSLLDAIARMDRAAGEFGGITQHIGAFRVSVDREGGQQPMEVAFIDTPGHEAFTEMRARGANVTDIAVIVVAADDGVMPQTEEAIAHARAAKVEIVVVINKIDKPDANIAKTRQMLAAQNLMSPDWGGSTEIVEVSATAGTGIKRLIEVLADTAELMELKCNPNKPAIGTVLEAHRSEGRGIVATVLVQDGTLQRGQAIVAGTGFGKVRAMYNSHMQQVEDAGPAWPVQVTGLSELPEAGSRFHGVGELKKATEIAAKVRQQEHELARARASKPMTLEAWSQSKAANEDISELLIVLKADAQGTCETIRSELAKFEHDEVGIKLIHSAVGAISTNDVRLAEASGAIVIGFNTPVQPTAQELADNHHVDIRLYNIIYKLLEDIHDALAGLLKPEEVEVETGLIEVRKTFRASKLGTIAGCYVTQGTVPRNAFIRLYRDNQLIYNGKIDSLKRFQDEVKEVREGFECGIVLKGFHDVREGDQMRPYVVETRERTLNK